MNSLLALKRDAWLILVFIFLISAWPEAVSAQEIPVYIVTDLGVLPGDDTSVATAINNKADVVGFSILAGNRVNHAFTWSKGVMTNLTPDSSGIAFSINDSGQVAGVSPAVLESGCPPAPYSGHAVLWQSGVMTTAYTNHYRNTELIF